MIRFLNTKFVKLGKKVTCIFNEGQGSYICLNDNLLEECGTFQPTVMRLPIGLKNHQVKSFILKTFEEAVFKISGQSEHFSALGYKGLNTE